MCPRRYLCGAVAAKVEALCVGPGTEADVSVGLMMSTAAIDKINVHSADALAKCAARVTKTRRLPAQYGDLVVLTGAHPDTHLAGEETFGPVAPIFHFEADAESLALADGTPFRLAARFYTRDMARAFRLGEALEFGMVALNIRALDNVVSPFGDIKASGLGRAPPTRQIGQPPFIGVPRGPHTVRHRSDADESQRARHPLEDQCCYRAGCGPATSGCPRR